MSILVHRANACDLLIYSDTPYKHGVLIFKKLAALLGNKAPPVNPKPVTDGPDDEDDADATVEQFVVGCIPGLIVTLHSEEFIPLGLNQRGTAIVDSISHLNANGEPNGFVPFESEWPVDLTKKTINELDQELKEYFEEGLREEISEMETKVFNSCVREFNADGWNKHQLESYRCMTTKDEFNHWAKIIYDQEHKMDWEPCD